MDQVQQIEVGRPCGRLQVTAGPAGEMQHVVLFVDQHIGRRIALRDLLGATPQPAVDPWPGAPDLMVDCDPGPVAGDERELRQDAGNGLLALEQPVAPIDRGEQLHVPGDVLRRAEEQEPPGLSEK